MRPFRIALGVLTFLKFHGPIPSRDELSRSLAHFPLIGILVGTVLVLIDQGLGKGIPILASNAILLLLLTGIRYSRGIEGLKIPFKFPDRVFSLCLKYFLFIWMPAPLRWISLMFMTTFSAGALTVALRRLQPETFDLENVLWASMICIFFGFICGMLGVFVTSASAGILIVLLRFLKRRLEWIEEGTECGILISILSFHYFWKIFSN
jgi:hypothetical protein